MITSTPDLAAVFNLVDNQNSSDPIEITKEMQINSQLIEKKQENTKLKRKITNMKKHVRTQKVKHDKELELHKAAANSFQEELSNKCNEVEKVATERDSLKAENER